MRPSLVVRRTLTVVAFAVGASLGAAAVSWAMTPRFEAERAGEHLVVGGFSVPAGGLPDTVAGTAVRPGTVGTVVLVTSAGLFDVRVANPRPLAVSDGADVSVSLADPDRAGISNGPTAVRVPPGETFAMWVTIAQRACAPGQASRVERGLHGVAVDVTAWGATRTEVIDLDLAAFAEAEGGLLPRCT